MTGPRTTAPADTTLIGHLMGPHGVQGGIKLYVLGESQQLETLGRVYVERRGWLRVRRTDELAPGLVLHLAGVGSREAAEELRGLNVYAADAELPPLPEGSYYYHDLRGLPVLNAAGEELGRVGDVLDMGHQDLLLVELSAREVIDPEAPVHEAYVPLQAPYVLVEPAGRKPQRIRLTADTPEGLLGDDEADHRPTDEPLEPTED